MSAFEKRIDSLRRRIRDDRQIKMERNAMHKAWKILQDKIVRAEANLAKWSAAHAAEPTAETRRHYLAAKLHLAALKNRAARFWTA